MAKKTKDSEINTKKQPKDITKVTTKKNSSNKSSTSTVSKKKANTSKSSATKAKKNTALTSSKKATTKKSSSTKTEKKTASAKVKEIGVNKTATTKKRTKTAQTKKANALKSFQSEYYDLPYLYNKTVVKILAQTPKVLFIYWEISNADKNNLKKQFGENFFENTRPVLIVFNDTMHYSFEVAINDFANSWYLHIKDANCEYHVELGRRPVFYNNHSQDVPLDNSAYIPYYIYVTSSNEMTAPNNHILFNPDVQTIRFRNVKTGQVIDKDIKQFTFITNFGIFTIQDLYKYLYPNEGFEYENIVLGNTSSGALSSSGMFSSQFK